jgi:hypothetical protein
MYKYKRTAVVASNDDEIFAHKLDKRVVDLQNATYEIIDIKYSSVLSDEDDAIYYSALIIYSDR